MNNRSPWKYVPPAGPVLSLLLIGLVLLSALLYYRAVKIQRYLEPALAISQPRNEFSKNITGGVQREFGEKPINGIVVKTSSILVQQSLIFSANGTVSPSGRIIIKKLARIFVSFMRNDHMRSEINLVLVEARFPPLGTPKSINKARVKVQNLVGRVQDALFQAEPELGNIYGPYFVAAAQPAPLHGGGSDVLEFRIISSELLHIEVLQKLMKYAF